MTIRILSFNTILKREKNKNKNTKITMYFTLLKIRTNENLT